MLDACAEMGTTFVAFSPLARGFLAGGVPDVSLLDAKDIRRSMPRFSAESNALNQRLLAGYATLAREAGCSPAQLALAFVLGRGRHVVAIPGTTSIAHLEDNVGAGALTLSPDISRRLDALINQRTVAGDRYNAATQAEIDTENFA